MKLVVQGGLGPGHNVLDGNPALPPIKGHSFPNFWPMSVVEKMAGWIKVPLSREVGLGPSDIV